MEHPTPVEYGINNSGGCSRCGSGLQGVLVFVFVERGLIVLATRNQEDCFEDFVNVLGEALCSDFVSEVYAQLRSQIRGCRAR